MPAKELMTWNRKARRWSKQYKGLRIPPISCRQLSRWCGRHVPGTREGSYRVANAWWEEKRREIDGLQPPRDYLDLLAQRRDDSARRGEKVQAAVVAAEIEPGETSLHVAREAPGPIPQDRTVGGQVKAWLAIQRQRVAARDITADRYDNMVDALERFEAFHGGPLPIESIDERATHAYFLNLHGLVAERAEDPRAGLAPSTADSLYGIFKQFVRSCYGRGLIDLPRNFQDPQLRIRIPHRKIRTIPVPDLLRLVEHAKGQPRLHILLAMNCGYGPTDIAELRDDEVDWAEGRIIRQRCKTRKHHAKDVPTVNYKLWRPTFELLREYRSGRPTVLLTRRGGPWAYRHLTEEGKRRGNNSLVNEFNKLRNACGVGLSFKFIRKTSAALLEGHEHFGRYCSHFLGESPRGIVQKHYVPPSEPLFDRILAWLGGRYGFET